MRGERLRKLRMDHKLTQAELGKKINVTKVSISGYESGNRTPDIDTLQKIAEVFNVSTDYLLGLSDSLSTNTKNNDLSDEDREMLEFFNDPETGLFFREMKEAPQAQLEEMREIWKVLKKRGLK